MPTGRMKWFDAKRGEGRIQAGKEYAVRGEDVEPDARVPGAVVHFDVDRQDGVDRAVRVRLREGTRVSPRQGRFGDLSGAKYPDQKGHEALSRGRPERHPDVEPHLREDPKELVGRWATDLERGDLSAVLLLYAPDARLHAADHTYTGRGEIGPFLRDVMVVRLRVLEIDQPRGADDLIVARLGRPGEPARRETRLRIRHGQVAEQWMLD